MSAPATIRSRPETDGETRAAAELYVGRTTHARLAPFVHRFTYRIASLFVDVDRIAEASRLSRVFSVNRWNLFSFHERDHGARDGSSLRAWAEARFAEAGIRLDGGAVRLFCLPRVLGYVFNPVSLWLGYGPDGRERGVIYEVNNTFGDTHAYVARFTPDADGIARHAAQKLLHVSPFFPVEGGYGFRLRPPGEAFGLVIRYQRPQGEAMVATHTAAQRPLTTGSLLRVFFGQPLLTAKVIGGIHLEALKLWRKGARYHSRPPAPVPSSMATQCPLAPGKASPTFPQEPLSNENTL